MRNLSMLEIDGVSGGGLMADITEATSFGAAAGAAVGFVLTNTALGATRGGFFGGAALFFYSSGFAFGTFLYEAACR